MTSSTKSVILWSATLTMFFAGAACRRQSEELSRVTVVGSNARASEDDAWPGTVAITQYGHLQCTGSVVTPTLIITAAHCLPEGSDPVATLKVSTGNGEAGGRYEGNLAIVRAVKHPDFRRGNVWGSADIAYLVLAEPLAVPFIPLVPTYELQKEVASHGAVATIVGFGITDTAARSLGVKHEATTTVKYATAQEVFLGDSRGDACGGDSGGPVFGRSADGAWYQFGVTSRGPTSCGSDLYPGAFSLITPHLCWIENDSGLGAGPAGTRLCASASASATLDLASLCRRAAASDRSVSCEDPTAWARSVHSLDLSRSGIVDLTPLTAFSSLERLNLEDNSVLDLAPLAGLEKMRDVRLGWNDVRSLDSLAAMVARGGRIRGAGLQNSSWHPPRNTPFLSLCQQAEAGALTSDPEILAATLAVKRAACLGNECGCYTANDYLNKARELNLSDARDLKSLAPLRETASLQYLTIARDVLPARDVLATLENLSQLDDRAWPE